MSRRALLSVSDKTALVDFAGELTALGWEIVATGGTQKALEAAGIAVTSIEDVTQFPECFGGRLKTIHPLIAGGVLFRRNEPDDVRDAAALKIQPIDLVVVNLYPFAETIAKENVTDAEAIEQIDIGGPTLLRAAAKNHESVTVVCDPSDYDRVLTELKTNGDTSLELRNELAAKVFLHTAVYDGHIAEYFGMNRSIFLTKGQTLRYGENPHQWGEYYSLYENKSSPSWKLHQGKELSYLNILDADAAWNAVNDFSEPTVVMVKHANPSGIASRENIDDAFQAAYDADRLSAFGVIIALNRNATEVIAQKIIDQKMFVEVVVAPGFDNGFLALMKERPNIRVMQMNQKPKTKNQSTMLYRSALGGMLVQDLDTKKIAEKDLAVVTSKKPTAEQMRELLFAWTCVKHTKSNAIVFAKDLVTVGIGGGQTSRVDATWIAAKRAGEKAKGAVMASDAFFPFSDSVEEAAKAGIVAIIQPGGSVKDSEVFAKAEELGLIMVTTGTRAFWH